jgi:hypothetical protein
MEQNFYRDEFEQMLRDTTDDFGMHPQRKVWHSIYNNFHPDRKWPSFAVSLVLLTAILFIGITNNNDINKERDTLAQNLSTQSLLAQNQLIYQPAKAAMRRTISTKIPYRFYEQTISNPSDETTLQTGDANSILNVTHTEIKEGYEHLSKNLTPTPEYSSVLGTNMPAPISTIDDNSIVATEGINQTNENNLGQMPTHTNSFPDTLQVAEVIKIDLKANIASANEEKIWIEDDVFHNKKNKDKWKNKLSVQFYITPSIGYRTRYKNAEFEPSLGLLQRQSPVANIEVVSHQAAMNIEAGAGLIKQISDRLHVKAGIQFNYSNYITYAHKLQHPSQTTVLLNDLNSGSLMPVAYSSSYGNVLGENNSQLNNSSVQLSIPIGVDYKIIGNGKVNWYAGASLQPGLVLNGNSYLISSDYKHFAQDNSLLRNFNVNSAIETFVSIKAPSGTMINLGPQFRYQLMSTHNKYYSYTEKLYNIGFKIGISKKL